MTRPMPDYELDGWRDIARNGSQAQMVRLARPALRRLVAEIDRLRSAAEPDGWVGAGGRVMTGTYRAGLVVAEIDRLRAAEPDGWDALRQQLEGQQP